MSSPTTYDFDPPPSDYSKPDGSFILDLFRGLVDAVHTYPLVALMAAAVLLVAFIVATDNVVRVWRDMTGRKVGI